MSDPLLEHYGVVVIDQAHERTVSTDLLMALLREVLLQRKELRVVLLSVTPASHTLLTHFSGAAHLHVEAPCSPEVLHSGRDSTESFFAALRLVLEVHKTKEPGDIAVFLASEQVLMLIHFFSPHFCKGRDLLTISNQIIFSSKLVH